MERKIFQRIIAVAVLSVLLGAGLGSGTASTLSTDEPPRQWVSAADNQTADQLPPKVEKGHPKLDSQLDQLAKAEARREAKDFAQRRGLALSADNEVRVVIEGTPASVNANRDAVAGVGGRVETSYQGLVQAVVPVARLTALADNPNVRLVRRPWKPVLATGSVNSEGVATVNATTWHSANFTGAGVKIAILDVGFQGYEALLGSELPPSARVTAQSFSGDIYGGGEKHGTAVAEIVYDMAPSVEKMYLVNAGTEVQLGNAVNWLISQGVNIISHSVHWPFSGSGDGTGTVDEIVDGARAAGILWVNAAGNWAQYHWQGSFVDTNSNRYHEFNPGDEGNTFTITGTERGVTVILSWDDPWGTSGNDYKLWLFDDVGNSAYSQSIQDGQGNNDYPIEDLSFSLPPGNYHIKIESVNNPQVVNFHLYAIYADMQYKSPVGSISIPADSPNALAVGAVPWNNPTTLESFSSQGPTTDNRIKPDLVAPDAVTTVSYTNAFSGTSASAPHVAGAAALIKAAFPFYSPTRLQSFLEGRAVDLGSTGKDNQFGSGRLSLGTPPAMYGDANGDNKLDAADITKLERIIGGLDAPTPRADANQDEQYNALDITKLERFIVGLYEPE